MRPLKTLAAAAASALSLGVLAIVPGSPATAATHPWCTNADLHAGFRVTGAAAGSVYGRIRLTNVSDRACVTGGYGGVSYVGDGDGTQIGHAAIRQSADKVASYVLKPGQRLVSPLQMTQAANYDPGACNSAHVDGFRVYVPNATLSQFVPHESIGCRNAEIHLLFQKPYRRP